jgi:hypothetical protein
MNIAPGITAIAVSREREPPVDRQKDGDADDQPDDGERRRYDRHLQQARRGVHVAREARQDPAGLHVPQLRQRQMQQAIEQGAAQREHEPRVQEPLPVVLGDVQQLLADDEAEERAAGEIQSNEPRRQVEPRVQQHLVDDVPHEERLHHFQAGDDQRQRRDDDDRATVRPEPAEVFAEILLPVAALPRQAGLRGVRLRRRRLDLALRFRGVDELIEAVLPVILDELAVALSRRRRLLHGLESMAFSRGTFAPFGRAGTRSTLMTRTRRYGLPVPAR